MPVNLRIRWDLSIKDLLDLLRAGFPVFKTPHVGNWYPNNLACAKLGIPMKVVDGTKGCLDKNFHPHCVIVGGEKHQIADDNKLTSHSMITNSPAVFPDRFAVGESVSKAHMRALQDALPQTRAQTVTEYFHANCDMVVTLLEIMTDAMADEWNRYVYDNGFTTSKKTKRGWAEIAMLGIAGLNSSRTGWVSPNIANILMDITIDAVVGGSDGVYELSGPDMYKYITGLMPRLSVLYDNVRLRTGWKLPETIEFNIVPVSDMRFVVCESRRDALDRLVSEWIKCAVFEKRAGECIRSAEDKSAEIAKVELDRVAFSNLLCNAVLECPYVFYDIYEGTFFSQYDLLRTNKGLYIHPWALSEPMSGLAKAVRTMNHLRNNAQRS